MDERQLKVREFYNQTLWETGVSNVAFISEDSWLSPDFFFGLACPERYFAAGFSPPFVREQEFIVLICPPTVVKTTMKMSKFGFDAHLNTWLWRIYKDIESSLEREQV